MCKCWKRILKFFGLSCGHGSGSGSGSGKEHSHLTQKKWDSIWLLRKPENKGIIGKGFHRSGWPVVIDALATYDSDKGILIDDFVEQNFCYNHNPTIYNEPWVGIFHHPPFPPSFSNSKEWMNNYLKTPAFIESQKNLKLAIVLSNYHKKELEKYLSCPVVALKHPISDDFAKWNPNLWRINKAKSIIQVGFYLRNTQLINQIPNISGILKRRLWNNREWINAYDNAVIQNSKGNGRSFYPGAIDISFQTPSNFDKMLTKNIVAMELYDASASNGVLDCIIRNTPLLINRHPAAVEYLGEDYPLYFNKPEEIPALIPKVEDAHYYLENRRKSDLLPEFFAAQIIEYVKSI